MPSAEEKTRVRFTYVFLGFWILAAIASYLYALWTASQQEKALQPKPAVDQIVKALVFGLGRILVDVLAPILIEVDPAIVIDVFAGDNGLTVTYALVIGGRIE